MLRRAMVVGAVLAALLLFISSCSTDKKGELKVKQNLAARVGNSRINEAEVQKRYERLPDTQKKDYSGLEGKAKLTDLLIDEQLLLEEALEKGLHREKEIEEKLELAKRTILVSEYYNREIVGRIEVSEEETQSYYDEHKEEFTTRAVLRAQYLFSEDSLKCVGWKERIDRGEDFNKIAKNESEDPVTAVVNGSLGYFNPDGYIKSVGYSQVFGQQVEKLEAEQVSGVISFERGFAIVKLNEKKPPQQQPLSEVRNRIIDKLRGSKSMIAYNGEIARLRKKFEPENYYWDKVEKTRRTPEEIWEKAQLETDPYQRVQLYRNLVNQYPDNTYAPQALFMIGFVYAEEVQDLVQARRTFDELLDKYPESDIVESAKWMLENINSPHPQFESIENMQEHIKQQKAGDAEKE